jgi:hypothetical protein
MVPCGGRSELLQRIAVELRACLDQGRNTTLMVWADLDHDMLDGDSLRNECWTEAQRAGISRTNFEQIVFIFAKDRLENWIQFLNDVVTDESVEAPRVQHLGHVGNAARQLATRCADGSNDPLPPSLSWSCKNWHALKRRMSG